MSHLDSAVHYHLQRGWILQTQSHSTATLHRGTKFNHILHALITLLGGFFTCGLLLLWAIPWCVLYNSHTPQQTMNLWVDSSGRIQNSYV